MAKQSAGLLLYRKRTGQLEVFLVHPGGPFWSKKDDGAWSIPKGEAIDSEDLLEAAKRELEEETGYSVSGIFQPLSPLRQPSGKIVHAWAVEADLDAGKIKSNLFSIELPRGSGKFKEFPEVDRADWFPLTVARRKLLKGQVAFLEQLQQMVLPDKSLP